MPSENCDFQDVNRIKCLNGTKDGIVLWYCKLRMNHVSFDSLTYLKAAVVDLFHLRIQY